MTISKKAVEKGTNSPPKIVLIPFDISAEEALEAVKDHLGIGKKVKKEKHPPSRKASEGRGKVVVKKIRGGFTIRDWRKK